MPIWDKQSISLQILYLCSLVWKIIPLYFLSSKIYNLLKTSPLIWKFLRFSSAQVKFCQIPCANFKTKSQFLTKFLYPSLLSRKVTPIYFFSSNNIYFTQKEPIKMKNFETCSNFAICQFWNKESIPLQILCPSSVSWKITPLYHFSSKNIYIAQKEPIIIKIFENSECTPHKKINKY